MMAILFLVGAAFVGIRIVNLTLENTLTKLEQIFFGIVTGWIISTLAVYAAARAAGNLSYNWVFAASFFVQVIAVVIWLPVLKRLRKNFWKSLFKLDYLVPIALLLVFAPLFYYLFSIRMFYADADGGLYSGGSSWNDMALHLAISNSFLLGANFPPEFPALAGEPLRYPFMPDFQTAILMALGATPFGALMLTGVPLALEITGIFYCLARRIVQTSRAAVLATILFLFNGGGGFLYFLEDWRKSGKSFVEFWCEMPSNYANLWDQKIHWANIIVDCFLPQRTSLYGISIALMTFILFAAVWRRWHETETKKKWDGWRLMVFAGVTISVLPVFHAHSFVAIGLVSIFLFLIQPRREWLVFWIPAAALAAFQIVSQLSLDNHLTSGEFFYWQPGWKGNGETSWLLYWLRNIGAPLLLIFPAWLHAARPWRSFYAAFAGLFAFCFCVMITPHDYDNIKLFYYWYGLSCILIADWLINLARGRKQYLLVWLLVVASIATGITTVQRESSMRWRSFSREEIAAADFVSHHASPRAVFLTAPLHNQPIMCLAGRPIVMGFSGWLWTHGYPTEPRAGDIRRIYEGEPESLELLRKYRVEYIYLSDSEREIYHPNTEFLNRNFTIIYQSGNITIYRVPN